MARRNRHSGGNDKASANHGVQQPPATPSYTAGASLPEEVAEFMARRPIFCAIAERCSELARKASKLPTQSADRKKLDQRFRKLEAYLGSLHSLPQAKQETVKLAFAQSLIVGVIRSRQRKVRAWEDVKELSDEFSKRIHKRPVGNPVAYRPRVTEALEMKLAHPERTWEQIHAELKLEVDVQDLKRQITLLRKLLKKEGISVHPWRRSLNQPPRTIRSDWE